MKSVLISHFYNEEYLLPWWLKHHLKLFDHGVLIDYHSTDHSAEICRSLAPHWEVISSRNACFDSVACDLEVMEIERRFPEDWKLALNTTEFLCASNFKDFLKELEGSQFKAFCIRGVIMVDPEGIYEEPFPDPALPLVSQRYHGYFEDENPSHGWTMRSRFLHRYPDGAYDIGRHRIGHPSLQHPEGAIISWFGFSPWNKEIVQRKLQIQSRIPKKDLEKGLGVYHFIDPKKLDEMYQNEAKKAEDLRTRGGYQDIFATSKKPSAVKEQIVVKEKILSTSSSCRVIPFVSSLSAQTYAWQRYLFFRPWYAGKHLVDIGFGEGFGIDYASSFAATAVGYETDLELVRYATYRYSKVSFKKSEGTNFNLKDKDFILCFEVLQQTENPEKFLQKLADADVDLILSVPGKFASEDAKQGARHSWSSTEFRDLIHKYFPKRKIQFLSQEKRWPGLLKQGFDPEAESFIAAISNFELPKWPKIGISIPTAHGSRDLEDAFYSLSAGYPGETFFAIVANGCDASDLSLMKKLEQTGSGRVKILPQKRNMGYGQGTNIGFEYLKQELGVDYFVVSNDDIIAGTDALSLMVEAMKHLEKAGLKPGVIAPVSNLVNGIQQVPLGRFNNIVELMNGIRHHHRRWHTEISPVTRLRGLFLLIHPDCMNAIGGFDPIFGLGNFEDDDHNIRTRLAGFSLWIAAGSFFYHKGSQTFQRLKIDYQKSIDDNQVIFCSKWGVDRLEDAFILNRVPEGVSLYVPLKVNL